MKIRAVYFFVFVFSISTVLIAETNSAVVNNRKPEFLRFKKLQNNAFAYAYYIRSSYLRNLVGAYLKSGKPDESSKKLIVDSLLYLERALKYTHDVPFLWKEYAVYNSGIGRMDGVIFACEKLAELEPSPEIYYKLGQLYNSKGNLEKAVDNFNLYLTYIPGDAKVKEYVAQLHINSGLKNEIVNNQIKAKSCFRQALNIINGLLTEKENARLLFRKGFVLELLGNPENALEAYSKAILLEPGNLEPYFRASNIYYAKGEKAAFAGNPEKAKEFYAEAAKTILLIVPEKKDNPEMLNYAAYLLALLGERLDFAEKLVVMAMEKDKNNSAFIDTLGWIHFKKGDAQNALTNVLNARESGGDDPVISDHLGDIYLKLGKPDKAKEMWLKSLDMEAGNTNVRIKIDALENP